MKLKNSEKNLIKNSLFVILVFIFFQAPIVNAEKIKIYAIGDSLTQDGQYLAKLSQSLGSSYEVVNKGIGGNTTEQMLARFQTDVLDYNPDYIIIWGGVNDIVSGSTASMVAENLQAMYIMAHNAGAKVISINITPFKKCSFCYTVDKQSMLDATNNWIAKQATNIDYKLDMYSPLEDPKNPDALLSNYDSGDGLHLNTSGQYYIGDAVFSEVNWEVSQPINCDEDTCIGNSCYNGTSWVYGTKGAGCARVVAAANPSSITPISNDPPRPISYVTWEARDASSLYVACSGLIDLPIGLLYLTDEQWYNNQTEYVKELGEPAGYPTRYDVGSVGFETCTFYPVNSSDGKAGIPKSVTITVEGSGGGASEEPARCGTANGKIFASSSHWGSYTFCASGDSIPTNPVFPEPGASVNWNCQSTEDGSMVDCSASRDVNVCKPDDPNCASRTCKIAIVGMVANL